MDARQFPKTGSELVLPSAAQTYSETEWERNSLKAVIWPIYWMDWTDRVDYLDGRLLTGAHFNSPNLEM